MVEISSYFDVVSTSEPDRRFNFHNQPIFDVVSTSKFGVVSTLFQRRLPTGNRTIESLPIRLRRHNI